MTAIQFIELDGQHVAVAAGGAAIIDARVTGEPLARVQAKALYALEIQAGRRRGPYNDAGAERYAQRAARRASRVARRA
jgi:hypothetical protein